MLNEAGKVGKQWGSVGYAHGKRLLSSREAMEVRADARKCSGLIVLMQRAYAIMHHRLRLLMQRTLKRANAEFCKLRRGRFVRNKKMLHYGAIIYASYRTVNAFAFKCRMQRACALIQHRLCLLMQHAFGANEDVILIRTKSAALRRSLLH